MKKLTYVRYKRVTKVMNIIPIPMFYQYNYTKLVQNIVKSYMILILPLFF